jgi:hypothetical protein
MMRRCFVALTLAAAPPCEVLARWRTSANTSVPSGCAQDQVDFAAAAPRRPIIARQQPQAGGLQMAQRRVLGGVALLLGGGRCGRLQTGHFCQETH